MLLKGDARSLDYSSFKLNHARTGRPGHQYRSMANVKRMILSLGLRVLGVQGLRSWGLGV